ncbi:hypothetical protein BG74_02585 [Sodalis-like endosymbiont of Proechinophthirus fluctus]|nr:hypothetical protein BG74_02585 [Sodalis-like endosymbiont of Proechinophthirus fluctus]
MEALAQLGIMLAIPTKNVLFNESEFPPLKVMGKETAPTKSCLTDRLPKGTMNYYTLRSLI